ncbi:MAG: glutamate--tRNA ligase, partial [Candidatus Norongarragalinales archaeon]
TRFLPEPNGPGHIGHAKAAWLNWEAARQYNGKCILRWDDTNPEKESQEFVDSIREDLKWLGLSFARESYTSDLMPRFYELAEKLVNQGDAYVCECRQEEISRAREHGKPCAHRERTPQENAVLWKQMVQGKVREGEAILRLKADMKSQNTVMRDPTLFRVIKTPHYRQRDRYSAWPTYDFEVSIADSLDGVTHALRSKEYELRDELYYYIIDKIGLRKPVVYDFSRLNIKGTKLSKRFIKPLIEEGKVSGWDDPRLPTIRGLKRRGILPAAIKNFVLSFGLSKVESEPSWEALLTENRRLLDPIAPHYFFVDEPVEVYAENAPTQSIKVGQRTITTSQRFFIAGSDAKQLKQGETIRLKEAFNIKIKDASKHPIQAEYAGTQLLKTKKIQWVPVKEAVPATLVEVGDLFVDDKFNPASLSERRGYCEKACTTIARETIVQFERVGFARLDDEKTMRFIRSC